MTTVSSCGVKLQEILSGLEKERLKLWRYTCTFVAFLNITILYFFLSTWGVTTWGVKINNTALNIDCLYSWVEICRVRARLGDRKTGSSVWAG